jgi:polysaccharide deacetylase family protein (PEP-CTERM system associated)
VKRVVNAMTIDVEDYFHVSAFDGLVSRDRWDQLESRVCANTERLLGLFSEQGVTATFFVLGWVAERFPDLVSRIAGLGHEVASHGYGHRLIYEQTRDAFREDVRRAKDILESLTGKRVDGYRAPSYSITPQSLWALDVLLGEGHRYDASIFPIRHDRYGIPSSPRHPHVVRRENGSLVEAPGSTVRIGGMNLPVAGGGYFRILPYAWTQWGIRRLNAVEKSIPRNPVLTPTTLAGSGTITTSTRLKIA